MPRNFASRMYVRIYGALAGSLVVAALLFAAIHLWFDPGERVAMETLGSIAQQVLPPASASPGQQQLALERWRYRVKADLALYGQDRQLIAAAGHALPPLNPLQAGSGRMIGRPLVFAVHLADGRWLVARRFNPRRVPFAITYLMLLTAVVVAIGAYPVVRRITARLERLQQSVQSWGRGDLSARVAVEGGDEVARLATSFNESASRIEALVGTQKTLLANASHELRSPLARIRMAVELMQGQAAPALRDELNRNIAELDQLIDELLLASRLDAGSGEARVLAEVDLAALVAEECARSGADFEAVPATLHGEARLLRRMVRNLLENGQRYGAGTPVTAKLSVTDGAVRLEVCDRGPGVPAAEREHIFTPFYRLPGASEQAGGVGLGLSLVRQIARGHRGDVSCEPRDGGGSCFVVELPRVSP